MALAERCLAADPSNRPPDAGAVAEAVRAHLAAVEYRLKRAEVDRARAEARADGERRRLAEGFAATALGGLAGTTAVAAWAGVERGRKETARAAAAANERKAVEKKEISLAVQSLPGDDLLRQADATAQSNLAGAYVDTGQGGRAVALLEPVRAAWLQAGGTNHPEAILATDNLATAYLAD